MIITVCSCGCNQIVKPGRKFIWGHNTRIRTKESIQKQIETHRKNHKEWHSEETRRKIGKANTKSREVRTCMCGCGKTFEVIITSKKKYIYGHISKEQRKAVSNRQKGKAAWNKGKKTTEEVRQKIREARKKQIITEEHKRKIRIARVERIKQNNGECWPNYNKEACEYFKSFDETNNTQGRYAVYGRGEYYIKALGYWPDYINFAEKLIMEWDEPGHFDENGNLRQKDINRQRAIQKHFSDFKFIRIKS